MQPGYISLVECNPMPATSTGIVAHATGRHEISRVECNPMPATSTGIVAHATGRHEISRVECNPMPTTSMGIVAHATGRHEMSLVACNPMPTTSTGIVPHATGRNEMSRVAYNPMPTIPYGDCPTRNWAARNVPRGIQPHADDPLRGLSHMQLGGTKCPALHTTRRHEISHMHFSDADIPVIVLTANKIYPRNP